MMANLQDIWGARAGRAKRDALVSSLLPQRTKERENLYRSVSLQQEQLSNPEQQTQTTGAILRAFWENGLHASFLKQKGQLLIIFWKMKEVQVSQRP